MTGTAAKPIVSVIVPTHDRPEGVARCLGALAAQTFERGRFEVIVVDDGSRLPPQAAVAGVADRLDAMLVLQARGGPASARNAGAARARGRFLAFTDDDCAPDPGWLAALARAFEARPEAMIGGVTENRVEQNPYADVSQALIAYLYEYYNGNGGVRFLTSNNMAVPADGFHALGGFSARFPLAAAEDRDLCERWSRAGRAMHLAPDAVVAHHHALTWRTFCRQHFNYGRGAHGFHAARAVRGYGPLRIEPLRFYLGLLRYPLARDRSLSGIRRSVLMGLTQVANAAGFFYEAAMTRFATRGRR
jgi:glycosyltransferase involved in cell wall biosynthesis